MTLLMLKPLRTALLALALPAPPQVALDATAATGVEADDPYLLAAFNNACERFQPRVTDSDGPRSAG